MKFSINQAVIDVYNKKAHLIVKGFGTDMDGKIEYLCCKINSLKEVYGWVSESELIAI